MITIGYFLSPSSFKASYTIPAVIEPSPIITTGTLSSPFNAMALAAPTPSEIEVELCPATK